MIMMTISRIVIDLLTSEYHSTRTRAWERAGSRIIRRTAAAGRKAAAKIREDSRRLEKAPNDLTARIESRTGPNEGLAPLLLAAKRAADKDKDHTMTAEG